MSIPMYRSAAPVLFVGLFLLSFTSAVRAQVLPPAVYSFEGFSDGDLLTTQYPGLTFSDATVATAGISLDEIEAPPHSGVNVTIDNGGPLSIQFASPVYSFGGYFNYAVPLTVTAFGPAGQNLGSVLSQFSSNFAVSGDPGSSPNEFLQFASPLGISSVTMTGDASGSSFTLDDATVTTLTPVPEASTLVSTGLLLASLGVFLSWRRSMSLS